MITLEKTARATKAATSKNTRPVTVTIDGDLAATIRAGAKTLGLRPDTWARMCVVSGDLASSDTEEAKDYRISMALSTLAESGRRFVEVAG